MKVYKKEIHGINNPIVYVYLKNVANDCSFVFKNDDSDLKTKVIYSTKDECCVSTIINNNDKKIKLFLKEKNSENLITTIKNSKTTRIKFKILSIIKTSVYKIKKTFKLFFMCVKYSKKAIKILWKEHKFLVPFGAWGRYIERLEFLAKNENSDFYDFNIQSQYLLWVNNVEKNDEEEIEKLNYNPLISLILPVYNVESKFLSKCLDSILNQSYQKFEICISDDCSTNPKTIKTLKKYEKIDDRIRVIYRKENGHISKNSNTALELAKGEFCGLVDNDDELAKHALYEVVKRLNDDKELDFIYSDEDKIDLNGDRCEPHFKPSFSPDTLFSLNYICHFAVIRTSLIKKLKGFTVGLEGAQDHDLFLRISEATSKIAHIPKILYHWRKSKTSTASNIENKDYAENVGKKAIEQALIRRKIKATIEIEQQISYYKVIYDVSSCPLVSIIIPTRDYADILGDCLESIYEKTTYKNFEVLVMNNQSQEQETFDLFNKYAKEHENFKVIDVNTEFNYSNINNIGVEKSNGEYVLLLNNDTKIITENWIELMLGYAMQSHIGIVGAKLYYPDDTIQHAGVAIGFTGVAGHIGLGFDNKALGYVGRFKVPYNYSAVTAACILMNKKKFQEVGGLEEELKVAYNDVDLNLKFLEKGYYNVLVPMVELYHYESKSRGLDTTSEKYKRFLFEQEYMYKKWKIKENKDLYYNENLSLLRDFLLDLPKK